jgi:hypothetical protein
VRPIAAEWPLPKVQRSVASQDDEWQVSAAAVIGLQNLTGSSQPFADTECGPANRRFCPTHARLGNFNEVPLRHLRAVGQSLTALG